MATAIPDVRKSSAAVVKTIARGYLSILGCAAVAWALYVLPGLYRQLGIAEIAKHIIQHQAFEQDALVGLIPRLDALEHERGVDPIVLRSAAIIRLRIVERSFSIGQQASIDGRLSSLHSAIEHSLAELPSDPFLWFALFWLYNTNYGFSVDHLQYLRTSYKLGPAEGWIAVRRNRYAIAIFSQLTPELAELATVEFANLVRSQFYSEAADILKGPGWKLRDILLPRLATVEIYHRRAFEKVLYDAGYDVTIPGVERQSPTRPWR